MNEILPGIFHWVAPNPSIGGKLVSSYWLDESGVLIDPLLPPDDGLAWLQSRPTAPQAIVLTNRHHRRDSERLHEHFDCPLHVPEAGRHAFNGLEYVVGYRPGDALPGGLSPFLVGALSPDEHGLHLPSAQTIWVGDTLVRSGTDPGSRIGWVIDALMDEPERTKGALLEAFRTVLERHAFDHLMLAHGLPLIGVGRSELEALVAEGGRTATDAF
ncbi:MAG TPA: hypothetical protein VFN36_06830 [Solirubrobacteraceae bacterium]|nr:hypothetical protein [Solirubrobacteraceae bacterium]